MMTYRASYAQTSEDGKSTTVEVRSFEYRHNALNWLETAACGNVVLKTLEHIMSIRDEYFIQTVEILT